MMIVTCVRKRITRYTSAVAVSHEILHAVQALLSSAELTDSLSYW